MRGGKLMAEESPAELIIRFRAETLEEVFLNLSIMQSEEKLARDGYNSSLPIEAGSVQSLAAESVSEVSVIGEHGSTDVRRLFYVFLILIFNNFFYVF